MKTVIAMLMALTLTGVVTACTAKAAAKGNHYKADSAAESKTVSTAPDDDALQAALGKWECEFDGDPWIFEYVSATEAHMQLTTEYDDMYFSPDRSFTLNGKTFAPDEYDFTDGRFTLLFDGKSAVEMEKTDDPDELFGEYRLTGGKFRGRFFNEENNDGDYRIEDVCFTMDDSGTRITVQYIQPDFELTADTVSIQVPGKERLVSSYEIDGDTMTITNSAGSQIEFTRKQDG
ncbi:MAG: hypothetical protein IKI77_01055 [Oscillospiraceae bacterium]|nr:hypothetical protein [Oscillospiraceae bacterium]